VDDLGYSDVGCFGAKGIKTPRLDQMAKEGIRLTDFYVAQAVCSASRAALMTGCYANRVGMQGALNHTSKAGLHPDEFLLPELLKREGYATGIYGKWHLGTTAMFHPMKHGLDDY
jgi:arylsulfatase A-like enzyme